MDVKLNEIKEENEMNSSCLQGISDAQKNRNKRDKELDRVGKVLREASEAFLQKSKKILKLAEALEETGDLEIIGEAISECTRLTELRIDLMAVRPIRALQREISEMDS
jgi:hypothetical protein